MRSVIRAASEIAHAEAIETVSARQATKITSPKAAEPKETKKHKTVKAGGTPLIINNVWIGDGKLGPLDRFNLYSWRALGHTVNIFAHRFDGKVPTAGDLGLESGDAVIINLTTMFGQDDSAASETPAGSFGSARAILKTWLSHTRSEDEDTKKVHLFNMIDLTKSYIGGTRRGIVLDMKVGPSVHLEDYAKVFHEKMISYTAVATRSDPRTSRSGPCVSRTSCESSIQSASTRR